MSDIQWIKLSVNMFDDEKIKLIRTMPEGESIITIWIQLLCLAGKINDGGLVYMGQNLAYSDEMLATILNHPLNTMRAALSTLEQFEMIDINTNGLIDIVNWEKHQSTDKMNQIKVQNRERQQRYYYRQKLRELGYAEEDIPNDISRLKKMYEEQTNVRLTLANGQEVRRKKKEVRSKKKEVNINNTHDSRASDSDLKARFDVVWSYYPNKKGKVNAFKAFKKAAKNGVTDEQIINGIKSYVKEIEVKRIDKQYIKHGSTWFNQQGWNDEYDTGQSYQNLNSSDDGEITPEMEEAYKRLMREKEMNDDDEFGASVV